MSSKEHDTKKIKKQLQILIQETISEKEKDNYIPPSDYRAVHGQRSNGPLEEEGERVTPATRRNGPFEVDAGERLTMASEPTNLDLFESKINNGDSQSSDINKINEETDNYSKTANRLSLVDAKFSDGQEWRFELSKDNYGKIIPNLANISLILSNDSNWTGVFGFDEFKQKLGVRRKSPLSCLPCEDWQDHHETEITRWLQRSQYKLTNIDIGTTKRVIYEISMHNKFHSLRDELDGLVWDGTDRLTELLPKYFKTEDTEWTRLIGPKFLIGLVARAFEPGCQLDTLLVLEGSQGFKKSSALKVLVGKDRFSDTAIDINNLNTRDCAMLCQGVWLCEIPELDGLTTKASVQKLKKFFRTREDSYVGKWETYKRIIPRSFGIVGTCNKSDYLVDETGNRSFLPARTIDYIDRDIIYKDRDQLIAESVFRYKNKESFWIDEDSEEGKLAREEQDERLQSHPWDSIIDNYISDLHDVSIPEILAHIYRDVKNSENVQIEKWRKDDQNDVAKILLSRRWVRKNLSIEIDGIKKRQWRYVRGAIAR